MTLELIKYCDIKNKDNNRKNYEYFLAQILETLRINMLANNHNFQIASNIVIEQIIIAGMGHINVDLATGFIKEALQFAKSFKNNL